MPNTPLAITSIAAMVMTPALLSPANNSSGVAMPMKAATNRAENSTNTAGARPLTIITSVTRTMIAAITGMPVSLARPSYGHDQQGIADCGFGDGGGETIADRARRVAHRLQNPQLLVRPLTILRAQPPQPEPP